MKAVIMAGGYATRLWPITKTKAKPLLPLGKKKIIDLIYEKLREFDIDIIVSTNKRFEKDFKEWAKDKDVELVIEHTTREEEKLGAVRALSEVSKNCNEDLLVIAGDNVFSFDLKEFIDYYKKYGKPLTALYDIGDLDLAKRYGVAELDGNRVLKFHEKPEKPPSTLIGVAIYALPREAIEILHEYVRKSDKKDNLGDFLSYLCSKMDVRGYVFDGIWYDVGNPDTYLEAFKSYTDHYIDESAKIDKYAKIIEPVVIEGDVKIKGRSIIGPYAYIGEGSVIEHSDISESVVFNDVILKKVKLWRSIIDDKCEIRNIELSSSVIGGHAKIQRA